MQCSLKRIVPPGQVWKRWVIRFPVNDITCLKDRYKRTNSLTCMLITCISTSFEMCVGDIRQTMEVCGLLLFHTRGSIPTLPQTKSGWLNHPHLTDFCPEANDLPSCTVLCDFDVVMSKTFIFIFHFHFSFSFSSVFIWGWSHITSSLFQTTCVHEPGFLKTCQKVK